MGADTDLIYGHSGAILVLGPFWAISGGSLSHLGTIVGVIVIFKEFEGYRSTQSAGRLKRENGNSYTFLTHFWSNLGSVGEQSESGVSWGI